MSVMSQRYLIITNRGISAPEHGNMWLMVLMPVTGAIYIYELRSNVKLPGS